MSKPLYVSEDRDEIYLPVADYTFNEAQATAAEHAREIMDEWGRARFDHKSMVPVHDHDNWEGCEECPAVMCYCFDVFEGN